MSTLFSPKNFQLCYRVVKHGLLGTLREERRRKVLENRILGRVFRPMRDANGEWRRLHNEELHHLYDSPNIVRVIKSKRIKWTGNVARMEEIGSAFIILTCTPSGKSLYEGLRVDGRT